MKDYDSAFPGSPGFSQDGMTLTQYTAIHLKVPMSGDPELDKMIRESRRLDFAGQALAGHCVEFPEMGMIVPKEGAEWCYRMADAMLAEWKKDVAND
jgi:hypothetical protein